MSFLGRSQPYYSSVGSKNPFLTGDHDGKLLEVNCHKGGGFHHLSTYSKYITGFSESHIDNEAGNLSHCFLNYQGAYGLALGEVRMPWI